MVRIKDQNRKMAVERNKHMGVNFYVLVYYGTMVFRSMFSKTSTFSKDPCVVYSQ